MQGDRVDTPKKATPGAVEKLERGIDDLGRLIERQTKENLEKSLQPKDGAA